MPALYLDILRLEDLPDGAVFQTIGPVPRRAVTTRFSDDITRLCVEIDRDPGSLTAMVSKMPVYQIDVPAATKAKE